MKVYFVSDVVDLVTEGLLLLWGGGGEVIREAFQPNTRSPPKQFC